MSKEKKKNWLVIFFNGHVPLPMTKKLAKQTFKIHTNIRYAVHIKKERKE